MSTSRWTADGCCSSDRRDPLPPRPARGHRAHAGAAGPQRRPDPGRARRRRNGLDAHRPHARPARRRVRRHASALVRVELLRALGRADALPRRPRVEARAGRLRRDSRRCADMPGAATERPAGSRWPLRGRAARTSRPTRSSSGPHRTTEPVALDLRDPRNRQSLPPLRGRHGGRAPEARASQVAAPTVSASMSTAALLYSGITVKMLVDKRLDAQLHTMFMVGYQPGAVAHPHDHPFEESYYMLEGEVDVVADGDRLHSPARRRRSGPASAASTRSTRPGAAP